MPSEDALTETQWLWLQCQMCLDDGVQACRHCDALGPGPFCTACGERFAAEEPRLCDACHQPGLGTHCRHCGAILRSTVEDAIEADTFDWHGWARSLGPFLGPLTPQEQLALAHDQAPSSNGVSHGTGGQHEL